MKYYILVLLCCTLNLSLGATCDSPLRTLYGFPEQTDTAIAEGANYCESLIGQESCCDAATFNSFQAKADALTQRLQIAVINRDKLLQEVITKTIPEIQGTLTLISGISTNALSHLATSLGLTAEEIA